MTTVCFFGSAGQSCARQLCLHGEQDCLFKVKHNVCRPQTTTSDSASVPFEVAEELPVQTNGFVCKQSEDQRYHVPMKQAVRNCDKLKKGDGAVRNRHGTGSHFVTQRSVTRESHRPGDPVDPLTQYYNGLQMST